MIWFAIGVVTGVTFAVILMRKTLDIAGSLVVEESEDGPYIFLELEEPIKNVLGRYAVTLRVVRNKYSTRR